MKKFFIYPILFLSVSAFAQHENCNHGSAPELASISGDIVEVPTTARHNINLTVEEARPLQIDNTITAIGSTEIIPQNIDHISSRISGKIKNLFAFIDEKVKKGATLFTLESRQIGNPPPTITFKSQRNGVIISSNISRGTAVEPNEILMSIADVSKLYAVANVPENKIGLLKLGQNARIRFEAFPEKEFNAKLVKLGTSLSSSFALPAYFEIDNADGTLKPKMRCIFEIITSSKKANVVVPISAIAGEHGNHFVFTLQCPDSMQFKKTDVALGIRDDKNVEILNGLNAGNKVAIKGVYQLQFMPAAKSPHNHQHEINNTKKHSDHKTEHDHSKHHKEELHTHKHIHTNECESAHSKEHKHIHTDACNSHEHHAHHHHEESIIEKLKEIPTEYWQNLAYWILGFSLCFNLLFIFVSFKKRNGGEK